MPRSQSVGGFLAFIGSLCFARRASSTQHSLAASFWTRIVLLLPRSCSVSSALVRLLFSSSLALTSSLALCCHRNVLQEEGARRGDKEWFAYSIAHASTHNVTAHCISEVLSFRGKPLVNEGVLHSTNAISLQHLRTTTSKCSSIFHLYTTSFCDQDVS